MDSIQHNLEIGSETVNAVQAGVEPGTQLFAIQGLGAVTISESLSATPDSPSDTLAKLAVKSDELGDGELVIRQATKRQKLLSKFTHKLWHDAVFIEQSVYKTNRLAH